MWPIVPTLTCGFLRSNFAFAIRAPSVALLSSLRRLCEPPTARSRPQRLRTDALRDRFVVRELHREGRATLGARPEIRGVAEHLRQRRERRDHLCVAARLLPGDAPPPPVDV